MADNAKEVGSGDGTRVLMLAIAFMLATASTGYALPRNITTDHCTKLPDNLSPAEKQRVAECGKQIDADLMNDVGRNQQHWLGCEGGKIYCCKNNPQGPTSCNQLNLINIPPSRVVPREPSAGGVLEPGNEPGKPQGGPGGGIGR